MFERRLYYHVDWVLIIAVLAIVALGLAMIYSTTGGAGRVYWTQVYALGLGLFAMAVCVTIDYRSLADKSPRVMQPDVLRRLYQSRERSEADREKRSLEERVRELERIIEEMRASDGKDRGVNAPRSSREKAAREELEKSASSLLRSALAAHGQDLAGDALAADLHAMVAQMREQVRSLREDLHELRQDISAYGSGGVER